jgi:hypothetical protein
MFRKLEHRLCLWMILGLAFAASAFAAETGSISGSVRGGEGGPLPGVTVTVSGPLLPAGRTAVTDDAGAFAFLRLPPGPYTVAAELSGLGSAKREAIVSLDKDTQLALTLSPSVSEEITVEAAQPIIDLKSTEIQVNYTRNVIEDLPLPRNYKGLFQLAPGVAENDRLAPNAGGSRMDNSFLIDGINVTNPQYGDILPNVSELDIEEVSIKRGGITAEFGRTGGMVVNAITRSGTNQLRSELRLEFQPSGFVSDNKSSAVQNTIDRQSAGFSISGPILRDRLWYYASANLPTTTTTDRRNNLGALPDEDIETDEYFGKVTANPTPNHFLTGSIRTRETTTDNANITSTSHPSVGSDDHTDYLLGTFSWTWNLSPDSFAEVKYNHNKEENGTSPLTAQGYRPAFDAAHPERMGRFTSTSDFLIGGATAPGQLVGGIDLAINNQDFTRDELRLTYQRFLDFDKTRHDVRAGVTYDENSERLERRANGWGAVTWNPTTRQFTASYVSEQPPHTGRGEAYGAFLQDQMTINERTTVTAGVLLNRDVYFGEAFGSTPGTKRKVEILAFDWDEQIQPRLGITFVPKPSVGDKLYANFGRYFNTENKSLGRAASPTRIFTTRATFDATGRLLSDVPAANTQNKKIDSTVKPMYTDEYLMGYARPLGGAWYGELWGLYRDVGDIYEDVSADGLGGGPFRVSRLPDAYRHYKAFTLQLSRRPNDERFYRLAMNASYTWSRLSGNWDIDFGGNSPFYNSSFIQDGPGVLITDNRDGILRGDRTHVAKVFAIVRPLDRLKVGTYVRYQSGGAWEARGLPSAAVSSSSYVAYLEKAGSRRMPDWLNFDLLSSYEFPLGRVSLEIEGRVTNLFDRQVVLAVDDRLILGRGTIPDNPNFGKGTSFSPPRAFLLSAIVRY